MMEIEKLNQTIICSENIKQIKKLNKVGLKRCPKWLKDKYRLAVNYKCQRCNYHEEQVGILEPHRIKRGNKGGLYTLVSLNHKLNNVKVVCNNCHKMLHANEWNNVKSK